MNQVSTEHRSEVSAEYKRWRNRAIKDMKEGRQIRPFATLLIPDDEYERIYSRLQQCKTVDEVRTVFHVVRPKEPKQMLSREEKDARDRRHYLKFLAKP
jgi:hypothetical protein